MPEDRLLRAPLTSVACEVRFEDASPPAAIDFLSRLEPLGLSEYTPEEGLQVSMGPTQVSQATVRRHRFGDPDGTRALTVDDKTFVYETAVYGGVDDFLAAWQPLAEAVQFVVGFRARTRIGLRYSNQVSLADRDRQTVAKAIEGHLLPPWDTQEHLTNLVASLQELRFDQREGELAFRHGLQYVAPSASPVYLLDYDHYEQRLRQFDPSDEAARLRRFNATIYDVFRWSLTDEQYQAFSPKSRA